MVRCRWSRTPGGGKQRQQHGRLDEHAHEQLADAADTGVGVGRIHTAEGEEETSERQAVHDGNGVTKDRDGALRRKERQTHREHKGDGEEQRRHDAQRKARILALGLGARKELGQVAVVLHDAGAATVVHLARITRPRPEKNGATAMTTTPCRTASTMLFMLSPP